MEALKGLHRKVYVHLYNIPNRYRLQLFIGVEKNNDMARKSYFSSNHKDAPKDVILTESRLEKLAAYKRQKRPYTKHNEEYWDSGISVYTYSTLLLSSYRNF